MIKCKICGKDFNEEQFNGHPYKVHEMKVESYFLKFYNKKDLFTNELIPFKSISQYLSNDFINKNNFKSWIKANSKDCVRDYCIKWLDDRKKLKGLRYAPSQAELKTLVFPNIHFLDSIFKNDGGYYKICENLGYFARHNPIDKNTVLPVKFQYSNDIKIIKDTREGRPLVFPCQTEILGLEWGDYALNKEDLTGKVRIERKSLSDFIGTLSSNYDRFSREIERAVKDNGYIVVLVEEKFQNLLSFEFLAHISKKIKARADFITHRLRELAQYFDNIQFLFVDGRKEASRIAMRIFQIGPEVKTIDLQLAYDLGILN